VFSTVGLPLGALLEAWSDFEPPQAANVRATSSRQAKIERLFLIDTVIPP
jgi:hypothetical protein